MKSISEMRWSSPGTAAAVVAGLALLAVTACSSAMSGSGSEPYTPVEGLPHTEADVHFMSGMIPHHAQAVVMSGWAESHGARSDIRILAERISVAQQDEIALMQRWLRDHGEPVPEATATHMTMTMGGVEHDMLMPGMLTDEELAQLDAARGTEFDRLFLTFMIRHHEGALTMVDELFTSQGAAQDETVFRFASDAFADQTTEINFMMSMLESL